MNTTDSLYKRDDPSKADSPQDKAAEATTLNRKMIDVFLTRMKSDFQNKFNVKDCIVTVRWKENGIEFGQFKENYSDECRIS